MANVQYSDEKGDQVFELKGAVCTFGRGSDNSCLLRDRELSRQHFQIERTEYGFKVVDRESRNGTRVNDNFVNQHLLRPGDRIQVGKLQLTFADPAFVEPPADVLQKMGGTPAGVNEPESKLLDPQFSSATSDKQVKPNPSRIRSGGTTAIYKVRPSQRGSARGNSSGSKTVLTSIFAIIGLFLGLVVIIVIIGSDAKNKEPGKAPSGSDWKDTSEEPDPNELAIMSDIRDRLEKEDYAAAVQLAEVFLKKYPDSDNIKTVRKYRKKANENLDSKSWRTYHHLDLKVKDLEAQNKFVEAIRLTSTGLENPELAPYQSRLTLLKNNLVLAGKKFYKARIVEGEALIDKGAFTSARTHFGRLHRELYGGQEFGILVQAVELHLKSLTGR